MPTTLIDGLVSRWRMEEASGTRYDTWGAQHLTDNQNVARAVGKINYGAQITTPVGGFPLLSRTSEPALSPGNTNFTLACWVKWDSLPSNSVFLMHKGIGDNGLREYGLLRTGVGAGNFVWRVSPDGIVDTTLDSSLGTISTGVWYLLICDHDADNDLIGISVNDSRVTQAYSSGVYQGAADFEIGRRMQGIIDEALLWNRVLTSAERTELYNGGSGVSVMPTAVHMKCLTEIKTEIDALALSGTPTVYKKKLPTDRIETLPCIVVSYPISKGETVNAGPLVGTNQQDAFGFPVWVTFLQKENADYEINSDADTVALWRQKVLQRFSNQRINSNASEIDTCLATPLPIVDLDAFVNRNLFAGTVEIMCIGRLGRLT
jgi:concanavalin A-like lectin/glucanase superfamily protein